MVDAPRDRVALRHPLVRRWLPAIGASAVVAVVLIAGLAGRSDGSGASPTPSPGAVSPAAAAPLLASESTAIASTTTTVAKTQLSASLSNGMQGDQVKMVQQRLAALGFQPGPIDGVYGGTTVQAVWAFEKLVLHTPRAQATGVVTNEMWQTMQGDLTVAPRRTTGLGTTHVEIYVPEQVMAVFKDDVAEFVTHVATGEQNADGSSHHWCDTLTYDTDVYGNHLDTPVTKQECADSKTPGGIFRIQNRFEGDHISPLGGMLNPVFFNYGIAIHGAYNVPLAPASHGCVRISNFLAKTFPSLVSKGDLVYVWAQDGKEPEKYSKYESLPSFNQADPNATTTTVAPPPPVAAPSTSVAVTTPVTTPPAATSSVPPATPPPTRPTAPPTTVKSTPPPTAAPAPPTTRPAPTTSKPTPTTARPPAPTTSQPPVPTATTVA